MSAEGGLPSRREQRAEQRSGRGSGQGGPPRGRLIAAAAVLVLVTGAVGVWIGTRTGGSANVAAFPGGSASTSASAHPGAGATGAVRSPADAGALATAAVAPSPTPSPSSSGPIRIVTAGDIACDPDAGSFNGGSGTPGECQQKATAALVARLDPQALLPLGDLQYENGTAEAFATSYAPTWGRFKDITYPVPGNHDYKDGEAKAYFDFFGDRAGERGKGWYSYDLGSWHLIALNSNCDGAVACDATSEQLRWLRADLAAHPNTCTLAYWHHARWSHGDHGDTEWTSTFVQALYDGGADVILSGHDHDYERLKPKNPNGDADPQGLRAFVVGSGGRNHYRINDAGGTTEAFDNTAFGVLQLTLKDGGYDWKFVGTPGSTFTDSGSDTCHGAP